MVLIFTVQFIFEVAVGLATGCYWSGSVEKRATYLGLAADSLTSRVSRPEGVVFLS